MNMDGAKLSLVMEKSPVTLDYPGAKGVVFHDAVFVVKNDGDHSASAIWLQLKIEQGGKILFEGPLDPAELGKPTTLEPGGEARISFFRALQAKVQGFGSRVNFFGYKAALNWTYRVGAEVKAEKTPTSQPVTWTVCWSPSADAPNIVEVKISS